MWRKMIRTVALALLTAGSAVTVLLSVLSYTTFPATNMSEQLGHWGAVLCWSGTIHLVDVVAADDRNMLTVDETKQWHQLIEENPRRSTLGFYRHNIVVSALYGQPYIRHRRIDIPLWAPFVACSAYPLVAFVRGRARRRRQRRRGLCKECQYDLTGNVSGVCPECATPIASPVGHEETARTE